jgi:arabinose-5-phosphate isomerase
MSETQELTKRMGREVLKAEAEALLKAASSISDSFSLAAQTILGIQGKVVLSGLGKSGHIARKLAATMASTGTPAFYLHPGEAMHGDLGVLQKGDLLLAIAYSGETAELLEVAKYARRRGVFVVSITGKLNSPLAELSDAVLDGSIDKEADGLGLAPTNSSTVALGLGDALAIAVMRQRKFTDHDFAAYHPGGKLGKRLSHVRDQMKVFERASLLLPTDDFHGALKAVTCQNFGIAPVLSVQGDIVGTVTDGDLRRALLKYDASALSKNVSDLMNSKPKTILSSRRSVDAVNDMDQNKITSLLVVNDAGKLEGIVRMHDLLEAKII